MYDFVTELRRHIEDRRNDLKENLAQGYCRDYAVYREYVGQARALEAIIEILNDVEKKYIEE